MTQVFAVSGGTVRVIQTFFYIYWSDYSTPKFNVSHCLLGALGGKLAKKTSNYVRYNKYTHHFPQASSFLPKLAP